MNIIAACARIHWAGGIFDLDQILVSACEKSSFREGGNPVHSGGSLCGSWIPAFSGMTNSLSEACIYLAGR